MKTLSFSIRPFSEVMEDFTSAFEAVRRGRRLPKGPERSGDRERSEVRPGRGSYASVIDWNG